MNGVEGRMWGNLRSQGLGFISFYHCKNSVLFEMNLVCGGRECCSTLLQCQWAGSGWTLLFSLILYNCCLLTGPVSNPSRSVLLDMQSHTHIITPTHNPAGGRRKVTFQMRRNSSTPCVFPGIKGLWGNFIWVLGGGRWILLPLLSEFQLPLPGEVPERISARWHYPSSPSLRSY